MMESPIVNPTNPRTNPVPDPMRGGTLPTRRPVPNPIRPVRMPFMPVYHRGINYVPKTGPAMLEKGEAVIPKEQNMDSVKDVLGGHSVNKPPKKLKHMTHRRTENGGHIFEHHYTHPEHHKMDEHAYSNDKDAINHFVEHGTDMQPEAPESGAPEPVGSVPGV